MYNNKDNGLVNLIDLDSLPTTISHTQSYADKKNARFANPKSEIYTVWERWKTTYNALPKHHQQVIEANLQASIEEFRRNHPELTCWEDLERLLAKACTKKMSSIKIDGTMQRLLSIPWVLQLLNKFDPCHVVPIQVYKPTLEQLDLEEDKDDTHLAWDGQHTIVLLWIIAVYIFEKDPAEISIPCNVYSSSLKDRMRTSFVVLNGPEGKRGLDAFDLFEQMVYAVRIDNSDHPEWVKAEKKQATIEERSLFVTNKKFGDEDQPGAISRMQEINKLDVKAIGWLCEYLVAVGCQNRPVEEKEMVMMAYFFDSCQHAGINCDQQYIQDIAAVTKRHWNADFSPTSNFWIKANHAYNAWHAVAISNNISPRFKKEPVHGFPFMIAQFQKDLPNIKLPNPRSTSEFQPSVERLF